MERPTQAKKNYKPAQVVLDYTIQRRTSEKVKADQAKAKANAAAAEAEAAAHKQSQLNQVAALKDAMQAEDAQSLDVLRPDLYIDPKSALSSASEVDTLSDSHLGMMLDDPIRKPCDPVCFPPDQSSYCESSHSEEFLTGWQKTEENPAVVVEENEEDQDQDYVQSDSEASHVSQASPDQTQKSGLQPKAKFKPQHNVSLLQYSDAF